MTAITIIYTCFTSKCTLCAAPATYDMPAYAMYNGAASILVGGLFWCFLKKLDRSHGKQVVKADHIFVSSSVIEGHAARNAYFPIM